MCERCPFRPGDRVRWCGPLPVRLSNFAGSYDDMRSGGTVQWCRLGRIGANPPRMIVQVYWPKIEQAAGGWRGRGWVCRYIVPHICFDPLPEAPGGDAMRTEDV